MGNALHDKCDCCGQREDYNKGIYLHAFGGYAGYGSTHDGEYMILHFCSECLDRMLETRPPKADTN